MALTPLRGAIAPQWRMNPPTSSETAAVVAGLLVGFLDIRSIWSIERDCAGVSLLVFADHTTLERLHKCPRAPGVNLFVVTDGDSVLAAWSASAPPGSLARWAWRQTSTHEAYYDEARWGTDPGAVVRVRRRAQLLWSRPENS